ncbi:ABC transporter substrate-binding protein [Paenarthrobacter aurescens]|uniref:ABC transporter substrate-binding protein n=1 Tax=Paenarthrobacter aurescens TaxID=43663 RepID=A0A4Y3NJF8_PAEAU|nr:ABC transporter substrate-binding protein [Paenarthrobacter aurescens]MDO6142015.1 ABC transporter substrate-binding protein [Paenarthrobacter aurescens]MDO6145820.1 ABC transporter substrate-binding protein [Paenarthrobacter aurescens]MDO6157064.1 ABC transporter substrate-binding protein [Paenarthrobacter aurescens]MDO6161050.1 ABC transporter substrate-binding protein [Paenarthrobacter aurescens]GEB19228.1 ABC transporter substrate-binding protein [Paenarthrobacter aurescens]
MKCIPGSQRARPGVPALVVTAALLLSVTACSPAGNASTSNPSGDAAGPGTGVPALEVNQAAVDLLPESIKASKVLRVAIPTNEPPTQFYREGTQEMTGTNPDVARLIGEALGVEVDIQVANFDSIIPGLAADRYDMTVSSMTPTEKRMEVLDFVDYLQVGNAIAVPKGNPAGIKDENALCGKKVGLLTGSYQLTVNVPLYDEACVAAGKDSIQKSEFQDTRQAISALTSGRLEAVLADSPILDYAATQNPQIEVATSFEFAPVGVGVPKDSGLVKAVSAALDAVIKSESYVKVLGKYGLESSAVTDARVNFAQ